MSTNPSHLASATVIDISTGQEAGDIPHHHTAGTGTASPSKNQAPSQEAVQRVLADPSNYLKTELFFDLLQDDGMDLTPEEIEIWSKNLLKRRTKRITYAFKHYSKIYLLAAKLFDLYNIKSDTIFTRIFKNRSDGIHAIGQFIAVKRFAKNKPDINVNTVGEDEYVQLVSTQKYCHRYKFYFLQQSEVLQWAYDKWNNNATRRSRGRIPADEAENSTVAEFIAGAGVMTSGESASAENDFSVVASPEAGARVSTSNSANTSNAPPGSAAASATPKATSKPFPERVREDSSNAGFGASSSATATPRAAPMNMHMNMHMPMNSMPFSAGMREHAYTPVGGLSQAMIQEQKDFNSALKNLAESLKHHSDTHLMTGTSTDTANATASEKVSSTRDFVEDQKRIIALMNETNTTIVQYRSEMDELSKRKRTITEGAADLSFSKKRKKLKHVKSEIKRVKGMIKAMSGALHRQQEELASLNGKSLADCSSSSSSDSSSDDGASDEE